MTISIATEISQEDRTASQGTPPPSPPPPQTPQAPLQAPRKLGDCTACRVTGTVALTGLGLHCLNQSRRHAPGSVGGKRVMAAVGLCTCSH
ncbi:hypothetical protein BOTBODRAFT_153491 [Botryobasidium botryosum FD-172 SS1]|uniref:Distal membrane-arm assembly complex protein 1-like domain-containing protein n=1 Tax=Botryobasidium botryosum (strain FD-172 SS1) TaxID=930990 RepID=A0A067N5Z3_BOTB1|nr:hypothetical protein BOTBODRAFT_153491 [Botryobasidium botryosum FD-172 SS1]